MKNYIFLAALAAASASCFSLASCSEDFIDEDLIQAQSDDYFKTKDGLDDLITGTYSALKFKFNYATWSYIMWPMGTDEFTDAANEDVNWNGYMLNATNGNIGNLWNNMFNRIESANIALKYIPSCYPQSSDTYNTRLGEAYFLRAFCFFQLVQQYGAVPLKTEASDGVLSTEFTRATEEECFAQIISDFTEAYNLLPTTASQQGRITRSAAAHFLAKAKLFRVSELHDAWNSAYKDKDLDDIITLSTEVLAAHPLATDYADLFDYQQADGANEKNSEVILAAQFSDDQSTWGRYGNQMHLAFPAVYQNMAGTKRDISGDREFCYLRTTNYTLDVFDRVNDSRFWKSFITTYGCNEPTQAPLFYIQDTEADGTVVKYPAYNNTLPAGYAYTDARFGAWQHGIRYIVNDAGDTEYTRASANEVKNHTLSLGTGIPAEGAVARNGVVQCAHTFVRYFNGDTENWYSHETATQHGNYGNYNSKSRFVALSKYRDGYRIAIANQFGTRDGIIARSAEDVLFIAEAYARKGDYGKVVEYVNLLRNRASYKAGEDRAHHIDGGQAYLNNTYCTGKGGGYGPNGAIFSDVNTYFESNKLEGQESVVNAQSSTDALVLNSVDDILQSARDNKIYNALTDKGFNNNGDETYLKVMNFLLNERTRELCGEMQRWIDLARTKALKGRWEAFNDGCGREGKSAFEDYMYLRPIPQTAYIDAITNADAASQQNPGYAN